MSYLGVGVGLRRNHFQSILSSSLLDVDWFEIISENFMDFGGYPRHVLDKLKKQNTPLICHGLGLSLCSSNPIPNDYQEKLKALLEYTDAPWFSDHLCISNSLEHSYHDLIPPLRTEESLKYIVEKIKFIQDKFNRPFAVENISAYVDTSFNTINEVDFINEILQQTGCYLLLDINNVYVNSKNFEFDPWNYLKAIKHKHLIQIHLAGHFDRGDLLVDTHGNNVCHDVWKLYEDYLHYIKRPISTLIEWDHNLPSFEKLVEEAQKAKNIVSKLKRSSHDATL